MKIKSSFVQLSEISLRVQWNCISTGQGELLHFSKHFFKTTQYYLRSSASLSLGCHSQTNSVTTERLAYMKGIFFMSGLNFNHATNIWASNRSCLYFVFFSLLKNSAPIKILLLKIDFLTIKKYLLLISFLCLPTFINLKKNS